MTFPALFFGFILAALYGAAFNFWRAESIRKLVLYLLLAETGFWGGHILGESLGWHFARIGPLNAGMATLFTALVLFLGAWLSQVEVRQK